MRRCVSLILGLHAFGAETHVSAELAPPGIKFEMQTNRSQYEIGTPMLVKLTLRNVGEADYEIMDKAGWGRSFRISSVNDGGLRSPVRSDVPHVEEFYMPPYFFCGSLSPAEAQSIVHFVRTVPMMPGWVTFHAYFFQRGLRALTPEVPLKIIGGVKEEAGSGPATLNPDERSFIYRCVCHRHNSFWRGRKTQPGRGPDHENLVAIVRKAMASDEASLPCEYALYAGVVQAIDVMASVDDVKLAEEAVEALEKRFPNSWLRTYTYAMLSTVHFERGNVEKARSFAGKGSKLPESNPLFQNLGIMEKLQKLEGSSKGEQKK